MKELFEIFITFIKIGGLTFGGGYAMLPLVQREVVEKKGWATMDEVMDWYAVSQCLPGILMVNTAILIGNKRKGTLGGIVAAIGAVFPSLIIITFIAMVLDRFAENEIVVKAFRGIRVCVCVLVLNAVVALWKKAIVDYLSLALFILIFALTVFTDISPIILVLAAGLLGVISKSIGRNKK